MRGARRAAVQALGLLLTACGPGSPAGGDDPWDVSPPAAKVAVHAEWRPGEVDLLDETWLVLDVWWRGDEEPELDGKLPETLEIVERRRQDRPLDGGVWRRFELRVRPLRPGSLELPPRKVRLGEDEAATPPLVLRVRSLLAEEDTLEPEAPAPPFPPPPSRWPWILGVVALALLVAAAFLRRRRRGRPRPATPRLPPHVLALAELDRLEHAPRRMPAEIDAFYVAVSDVVRRYLEERFGLHAPERTTEEFLVELGASTVLRPEQKAALAEFLEQCDLVKFARALPGEVVHRRSLRVARELVEATRPDRVREGAA